MKHLLQAHETLNISDIRTNFSLSSSAAVLIRMRQYPISHQHSASGHHIVNRRDRA